MYKTKILARSYRHDNRGASMENKTIDEMARRITESLAAGIERALEQGFKALEQKLRERSVQNDRTN